MTAVGILTRSGPLAGAQPHRLALLPATALSASGVLLFGFELDVAGYAVLAASLLLSLAIATPLFRDMALIAIGVVAVSAVPITTDISFEHMAVMGTAMTVAVTVPYLLCRFVFRDRAIRFPLTHPRTWTRPERWWLVLVVVLGYAILPVYMIRSGVYQNWPAVDAPDEIGRLFLGTNALGIWDELFFVCTVFTLLRRHLPMWQANLLQAVLFTSFLWELGFHSIGPLLIYPFALVQGWTFATTRSLTYVVAVHLLFDLVLFGVLVHAHQREWLAIFLY